MVTDFASLIDALAKRFNDTVRSQINRASVLAQTLPVEAGNGPNIQWVPEFGTSTGSAIADGADVTVFNNDDKVPAVLQYTTYHDAFALTGRALAAARTSGNPAQLAALFLHELKTSGHRLAKILNQHFWTGTGATNQMTGLLSAAGGLQDTGTYASIDRGTYTQWAGNVDDNSGTGRGLTITLMRNMRTTIYRASGQRPDLIMTSPEMQEYYGRLLGPERRYTQDVFLRGQKITLDGGYQALEFDGIPVVADVDCPTEAADRHQMCFFNTNEMCIKQLPDGVDNVNQSMAMMQLSGTAEEQFGIGQVGLQSRVLPLAISGDAYKFGLFVYPQIQVKSPFTTGVIKDLDPAAALP